MDQPPYYQELSKISNFLSASVAGFPHLGASYTARLLNMILGLEEIGGRYNSGRGAIQHAWSLDQGRGLYVDLTMRQFDLAHDQVTILPVSTPLLSIDTRLTEDQRALPLEAFFLPNVQLLADEYKLLRNTAFAGNCRS